MQDSWTVNETIALSLEYVPDTGRSRYLQSYKGWFIPPETTRYRFYMACDDNCKLLMDLEPGKEDNLTSIITQINTAPYNVKHRQYWFYTDGIQRVSDWVTLTKGEPYYLNALF
jgi:hypothetical protein